MKKLTLKNRKNQTIVGVLEKPVGNIKGTCIIEHGYSGFKEQDHIQAMKNAFLENEFITFNFDATNSFNESDGEFIKATLGLHYEDLEDVVRWAQKQNWFQKPLALTGHSMGGYAVARYAEEYPDEVDYLIPVAPLVSGKLSFEAKERFDPGDLEKWKKDGIKEVKNNSLPGVVKRMTWESMEERLNHNLLPNVSKLNMSTLFITGSKDESCPPDHVKKLFNLIPKNTDKQIKIIENAPHTYRTKEDLNTIKDTIYKWLKERV